MRTAEGVLHMLTADDIISLTSGTSAIRSKRSNATERRVMRRMRGGRDGTQDLWMPSVSLVLFPSRRAICHGAEPLVHVFGLPKCRWCSLGSPAPRRHLTSANSSPHMP